ncbi:hypothetical protein KBC70_02995 [Candidatus Woesebacteria bacterium]|nr:hypothetical protein [Candidatus Woesebacteria bacterium]
MPHIYVEVSPSVYRKIGKKGRKALNAEWKKLGAESMKGYSDKPMTIKDVDIRWVKVYSSEGTAAVTLIVQFTAGGPNGVLINKVNDLCERINYVFIMALTMSKARAKYLTGMDIGIIPRPQQRGGYHHHTFKD